MQTGETAWEPTGVGKMSLCAGLHGGRWSHRMVEVFPDLCMGTITSVGRAVRWSLVPFQTSLSGRRRSKSGGSVTILEAILAACDPAALLFGSLAQR